MLRATVARYRDAFRAVQGGVRVLDEAMAAHLGPPTGAPGPSVRPACLI